MMAQQQLPLLPQAYYQKQRYQQMPHLAAVAERGSVAADARMGAAINTDSSAGSDAAGGGGPPPQPSIPDEHTCNNRASGRFCARCRFEQRAREVALQQERERALTAAVAAEALLAAAAAANAAEDARKRKRRGPRPRR